jgi:hypothetical protein
MTCDQDPRKLYLSWSEKQKLNNLIKMQENGDEVDEEELRSRGR